ncbi:AAA family ATPase [Otariodibacter oris]|uniref:endopeptidase La n=1 Tax=Otariodibacter oris TaxID=1032623 RepID=A0A420XGT7_9PAST|nr:AAA family ATPase [Otariodibacter oris]QGM80050.1 protease [Otariodibacter oris]RKR71874.1 Lon-like ATP-dependent protease [Otariodibacter oris]
MQISPLAWQSLILDYPFSSTGKKVSFFDFQSKAQQAIDQFVVSHTGSLLVLKTETLPEFLVEIQARLSRENNKTLLATDFNRNSLLGYSVFLEKDNKIENIEGALQQVNGGILILDIHTLLLDVAQWDKLKQALLFGFYEPISANALPLSQPMQESKFKLVLVGSREDIATLATYDETLYQFAQYAEVETYLRLDNNTTQQWGDYVQSVAKSSVGKSFSTKGLNQLLGYYIRESESQEIVSISPTLLNKYLVGLAQFFSEQEELDDINTYFEYLEKQASSFSEYTTQDILNHQLRIDTEGKAVGQINGLSVVEFDGVPFSFGEPLRISCNVQYGEGEIHDIERKVELGGNIHSKGILLAQSCLAHLLELPTQLPFSASLAFEQSYGEIDGDSSSLAIFCALISALSALPLPQSIAVTGAIDQFGNVLSVGGVNQKIEGFFNICQARGLTGKQGVIIPKVCIKHLSLKPEVFTAIKGQQFFIWTVSDVFEAMTILFEHYFSDKDLPADSDESSIFSLIHEKFDKYSNSTETSGSFFTKFCKFLR